MLTGDNIATSEVHGLDDCVLKTIKAFFQGAVYSWCNNKGTEWFRAWDFLGGKNADWGNTPLQVLYDRQKEVGKNYDDAYAQAAIDAGRILKKVLFDDNVRTFETKGGFAARSYRWTGK